MTRQERILQILKEKQRARSNVPFDKVKQTLQDKKSYTDLRTTAPTAPLRTISIPQPKSLLQRTGEYLEPKPEVRAVDVIGEIPGAIHKVATKTLGGILGVGAGLVGGVVGGITGATGESLWQLSQGKPVEAKKLWDSTVKTASGTAKFGYTKGKEVGDIAPLIPFLLPIFVDATGTKVRNTFSEVGKIYEENKMAGVKAPRTRAVYAGLKEGSSQGWQLLGVDKKTADDFSKNVIMASVGNILLYGSAYLATRGVAKQTQLMAQKLPIIRAKTGSVFIREADSIRRAYIRSKLKNTKFQVKERVGVTSEGVEIFSKVLRKKLTLEQINARVAKAPHLAGFVEFTEMIKTPWGRAITPLGSPKVTVKSRYIPDVSKIVPPAPSAVVPSAIGAPAVVPSAVVPSTVGAPAVVSALPKPTIVKPVVSPVVTLKAEFQILDPKKITQLKSLQTRLEKSIKTKQELITTGRATPEVLEQRNKLRITIDRLKEKVEQAEKAKIVTTGPIKETPVTKPIVEPITKPAIPLKTPSKKTLEKIDDEITRRFDEIDNSNLSEQRKKQIYKTLREERRTLYDVLDSVAKFEALKFVKKVPNLDELNKALILTNKEVKNLKTVELNSKLKINDVSAALLEEVVKKTMQQIPYSAVYKGYNFKGGQKAFGALAAYDPLTQKIHFDIGNLTEEIVNAFKGKEISAPDRWVNFNKKPEESIALFVSRIVSELIIHELNHKFITLEHMIALGKSNRERPTISDPIPPGWVDPTDIMDKIHKETEQKLIELDKKIRDDAKLVKISKVKPTVVKLATPPKKIIPLKAAKIIKFDDLSIRAKTAIQAEARVKITNLGLSPEEVNPFKTQWVKKTVSIESLKTKNVDVFADTFTKRGAITKGCIIVDKSGIVIDGNNRLREAFDRGEKDIEIFKEITKPEVKPAVVLEEPGVKLTQKEIVDSKKGKEISVAKPAIKPEVTKPITKPIAPETKIIDVSKATKKELDTILEKDETKGKSEEIIDERFYKVINPLKNSTDVYDFGGAAAPFSPKATVVDLPFDTKEKIVQKKNYIEQDLEKSVIDLPDKSNIIITDSWNYFSSKEGLENINNALKDGGRIYILDHVNEVTKLIKGLQAKRDNVKILDHSRIREDLESIETWAIIEVGKKIQPTAKLVTKPTAIPTVKLPELYHGSFNGKLKLNKQGNIDLTTEKPAATRFSEPVTVDTKGLKAVNFETKRELFNAAANKKKYQLQDIDVLISDNHAIAISPRTFAKKVGFKTIQLGRQTVGELAKKAKPTRPPGRPTSGVITQKEALAKSHQRREKQLEKQEIADKKYDELVLKQRKAAEEVAKARMQQIEQDMEKIKTREASKLIVRKMTPEERKTYGVTDRVTKLPVDKKAEIRKLEKELEAYKKAGNDEAFFRDLDVKFFTQYIEDTQKGIATWDRSEVISDFIEKNFEEVDFSSAGFIKIPSTKELVNIGHNIKKGLYKIGGKIDVTLPFTEIGAPKTGTKIKNYYTRREAERERGRSMVKKLTKLPYNTEDYKNITYYASQTRLFEVLSESEQARLKPLYDEVRTYFDDHATRLEQLGVFTERWPQSYIHRLSDEIGHIKEAIQKARKKSQVTQLTKDLITKQNIIRFLKGQKIKYVHLPLKVWFDKVNQLPTTRRAKVLNRFFHRREVVSLKNLAEYLIKEGILNPKEIDIRNVIAAYSDTVGRTYALSDIFVTAHSEGLVKPLTDLTKEWPAVPSRMVPELKGYRVHPVFANYLEGYLEGMSKSYQVGRIFGGIKIMQFYNPIILPLYDTYQAFWLGSVRSIKTPKYAMQAVRSMKNRDDGYWLAYDTGVFSKPYLAPFEKFKNQIETDKQLNFVKKAAVFLKQGFNDAIRQEGLFKKIGDTLMMTTDIVYKPLHTIAWGGDKLIRLISFNYLLDRGFTPEEAGELTAFFHGDYARLTPKLRRTLNKIFFTPTFKIVMSELQSSMIKSTAKVIGNAARLKKSNKKDLVMMYGLVALIAGQTIRHLFMKRLGFKTDSFGLRYYKTVIDDEGEEKEIVVYMPSPDNIWLRYYNRWKTFPASPDKLKAFINKSKWDLHPVYLLAINLLANRKPDGNPIYNPFDDSLQIVEDTFKYSARSIFRIFDAIPGEDRNLETYKLMQKDLGKTWAILLNAMSLTYTREGKTRRIYMQMKSLFNQYNSFIYSDTPETDEEAKKRFDKFESKLKEIEETLKEKEVIERRAPKPSDNKRMIDL